MVMTEGNDAVQTISNAVVMSGNRIDSKSVPDPADDEFATTDLNERWTPVGLIGPGTVGLLRADITPIYDLITKPGCLLMQGSGAMAIRAGYILPDNRSIVVKVRANQQWMGGRIQDELYMGIWLNGSFAGPTDEPRAAIYAYMGNTGQGVIEGSVNGGYSTAQPGVFDFGLLYLRIARVDLTYYVMVSGDGEQWTQIRNGVMPAAPTQLWIGGGQNNANAPFPIMEFDFMREGANSILPWA